MSELYFELKPFSTKTETGRKGTVGRFGEVTVSYPRKGWSDNASTLIELQLRGERLPPATYTSVGTNRPTLKEFQFLLDGHPVELHFNRRGLRNKDRAMKVACRGRSYEYIVAGTKKGSVLRRTDLKITMVRAKNTSGKGISSFYTVTGEADEIDLALAIVFEEVDTFDLTKFGATAAALNKIYNLPRTNEPTATD